MFAFYLARGNEKVVETLSFLCLPRLPHTLKGCVTKYGESFTPKTTIPIHRIDGSTGHDGIFTLMGIGDSAYLLRPNGRVTPPCQ